MEQQPVSLKRPFRVQSVIIWSYFTLLLNLFTGAMIVVSGEHDFAGMFQKMVPVQSAFNESLLREHPEALEQVRQHEGDMKQAFEQASQSVSPQQERISFFLTVVNAVASLLALAFGILYTKRGDRRGWILLFGCFFALPALGMLGFIGSLLKASSDLQDQNLITVAMMGVWGVFALLFNAVFLLLFWWCLCSQKASQYFGWNRPSRDAFVKAFLVGAFFAAVSWFPQKVSAARMSALVQQMGEMQQKQLERVQRLVEKAQKESQEGSSNAAPLSLPDSVSGSAKDLPAGDSEVAGHDREQSAEKEGE